MNRIKSLIPLIAAAIFQITPSLTAQEIVFRADVPFQFSVDDKTLPAGTYRLIRQGEFLQVENEKQSAGAFAMLFAGDSSHSGHDVLIFDRVNGTYFLRTIDDSSSGRCIQLPVSRTEKNAIKVMTATLKSPSPIAPTTVTLAAR